MVCDITKQMVCTKWLLNQFMFAKIPLPDGITLFRGIDRVNQDEKMKFSSFGRETQKFLKIVISHAMQRKKGCKPVDCVMVNTCCPKTTIIPKKNVPMVGNLMQQQRSPSVRTGGENPYGFCRTHMGSAFKRHFLLIKLERL